LKKCTGVKRGLKERVIRGVIERKELKRKAGCSDRKRDPSSLAQTGPPGE